jgi:Rod binding domain-containing protein
MLENENMNEAETPQLNIGAVSGSFLFDKSLLEKVTIKQPEYVMGVDTYDKDALAYCFGRKVDGVFEIMLTKTMRDENEFKQEVENLAKYFNADVFRSVY